MRIRTTLLLSIPLLFLLPSMAHAGVLIPVPGLASSTTACIPQATSGMPDTIGDTYFGGFGFSPGNSAFGGGSGPDPFVCEHGYVWDFAPYASTTPITLYAWIAKGITAYTNGDFTYAAFNYFDGVMAALDIPRTTRIDYVIPSERQVVQFGAPFTLDAGGQLLAKDVIERYGIDDGLSINWKITPVSINCFSVLCAFNNIGAYSGDYREALLITGPGDQSWVTYGTEAATTTVIGAYDIDTKLQKPRSILGASSFFGLIGFGYETLAEKKDVFIVGSTTQLDDILLRTRAEGFLASTTEAALASCNPLAFSLSDCLAVLFIPSASDMGALRDFTEQNLFNRWPWGYATRVLSILSGNATTTASLPSATIQFPSTLPLYGHPITIDMQDTFNQGSTTIAGLVDPISGKNIREIVEPWIQMFIALSLVIIFFHDIMGMGHRTLGGSDSGRGNNSGEKYREWLYNHRQ